jgi:hypothetical protein
MIKKREFKHLKVKFVLNPVCSFVIIVRGFKLKDLGESP